MQSVSPSKESSIATHQKSVFQCPECEYEANRKGNLATHIKSIHKGEKFQCPECDYAATQKDSLVTHISSAKVLT